MTTFNVYRRESNDTNPPVAIATGLTSMSYSDGTAEKGKTYLYSVGAVKSGFEEISEEISILAGANFDSYLSTLEPMTWFKLHETSSATPPKDYGVNAQSSWYGTPSNITFNAPPLRNGAACSMGFGIESAGLGCFAYTEAPRSLNMTLASHTWFVWVKKVADTTQNRMWGDNGDGVNKRVIWNTYEITNNNRRVDVWIPIDNNAHFICVVYDTVEREYKVFKDGVWYVATYSNPPTSISGGQNIYVPAWRTYGHYGYRGYFSDFTMFDRALTADQVETLYALGKL